MENFLPVSRRKFYFCLMLFVGGITFAFAIAAILREDVLCIQDHRLDLVRLRKTARLTAYLLALLWASGLSLIVIEYGLNFHWSILSTKLLCKIGVVVCLTLNGLALHWIAFPRLSAGEVESAPWACLFGSVSTVSWLYAACVGLGRYVGMYISLQEFVLLYVVLLTIGAVVSLMFIAPRLYKQMALARFIDSARRA